MHICFGIVDNFAVLILNGILSTGRFIKGVLGLGRIIVTVNSGQTAILSACKPAKDD